MTVTRMPERFEFAAPWTSEVAAPGGRPLPLSDLGNAERFALGHSQDVRYIQTTRQWLTWNGAHWELDSTGNVKRCAKQTMRNMLLEAAAMDNEKHRGELIAHQIRSESDRAIRACLSLAESEEKIAARAEDFDRDPFTLTVLNGTIDLDSRELREHSRADFITKIAPVEFNSTAKAPNWERFVFEAMNGDLEKVAFLRRAIGYTLTGDTSEQCLFILHGGGGNGKSTLIETFRALLGDYASQSDFSTFLATKATGGARNDIARLRGARMVTAVESDVGRRLAENIVKHLTGGDTITARFLYGEHFEFRPSFKLWLATNNRPRITGTDDAIWRRIQLIPFTVAVPEEKRDRLLPEKLKSELSGILNWALEGVAEWQERGLAAPTAISDANAEYREREDALGRFLNELIAADPDSEARAGDVFKAYSQWAEAAGEHRLREKEFSEALELRGFKKSRNKHGRVWKSIRIEDAGVGCRAV